jgi:PAS domain-containing protein
VVSELATFLTRTRSPVFLADDDRESVDANTSACRLLGVSRSQLIAAVSNQGLASDRGRLAAA